MKEANDSFTKEDLNDIHIGVMRAKLNEAPSFIRNLIEEKIKEMKTLGIKFIDVPTLNLPYDFNADNLCYEFDQYIKGTNGPIQSLYDLAKTGEFVSYIDAYARVDCSYDNSQTKAYQAYLNKRQSKINQTNQFFETHKIDAILYPTLLEEIKNISRFVYNEIKSFSYNIPPQTGFPAINIPAGFYEELPYGLELVGQANQDNLLLSIAIELDAQNPSYTLPNVSPTLFKPLETLDELLEIKSIEHTEEAYLEAQALIDYFLEHYSDYNNHEKTAQSLIMFYGNTDAYLKKQTAYQAELESYKQTIQKALIAEGMLMILFIFLQVKKRKNKQRVKP